MTLAFTALTGLLFSQSAMQSDGPDHPGTQSNNDIVSSGFDNHQEDDLAYAEGIVQGKKKAKKKTKKEYSGQATYYNDKYHGRKTASGEVYDRDKMTAAVRRDALPLEFGTMVEVTAVSTGKKVKVKVNDRMSDKATAIIDLSYAAAEKLGLIKAGRMDVTIRVVK